MTNDYELDRKMYEFSLGQLSYGKTRRLVRLLLEERDTLYDKLNWLNDVMDEDYEYIHHYDDMEDY